MLSSPRFIPKPPKRRRCKRITRVSIGAVVGAVTLGILVTIIQTHHFPTDFFTSFSSFSGMVGASVAVSKKHKNVARQLAKFKDPRAVGPMAELLDIQDRDVRTVIIEALTGLLPDLKASDAALLDTEQRAHLYHALNGKDIALSLAILKALEQVGDSKALPIVEKLAAGEGKAAKEPRLQDAAQQALPALRQRISLQQASSQLLRASDAISTPPEQLLRAATGHAEQHAEMLLRASNSDIVTANIE